MDMKAINPQEKHAIKNVLNDYKVRQCILLGIDVCCILITFLLSIRLIGSEIDLEIKNIILPFIINLLPSS